MRSQTIVAKLRCLSLVLLVAVLLASWLSLPAIKAEVARADSSPTAKIAPTLLDQMAADRTKQLPIIVEMKPLKRTSSSTLLPNEQAAQMARDLLGVYGRPAGMLALVDGAAGFASAGEIESLALDERVAYVHPDSLVQPRRSPTQPATAPPADQASAQYPRVVEADRVWQLGATGNGIGVAVLDSGVMTDPDLTQPVNRLVAAVNFAGDRGPLADAGGHGTHVAGIIAGNGTRSAGEFVGIAPKASILDVRVLDQNGVGRVSSILRGIEWVLAHQAQYNIRIMNLSFGAVARSSYRRDPLAAAVEIAWKRGLVVVAAAGNGGPQSGTVETPGIDPYVITVGATDDRGTVDVADDELAWFSAWGTPSGSIARPDLVAPGRRLVSLRVPGSYLDQRYPERVVTAQNGSTYFRLTGTSMSTPVVSGIVALVVERQPYLTPDQVKAILIGATRPYGQTSGVTLPDPSADGAGLVDAFVAASGSSTQAANQGRRPSNTFARSLYPILYGQPLNWKDPIYLGIDWNSLTWETLNWDNAAWDNAAWDSFQWNNAAWDNAAWDNAAWDNAAWDNAAWDNAAWDSMTMD